jgi:hypothetical protein
MLRHACNYYLPAYTLIDKQISYSWTEDESRPKQNFNEWEKQKIYLIKFNIGKKEKKIRKSNIISQMTRICM